MSRPKTTSWESQHRAKIRHCVALEAARLLYHREVKEYFHAKREAAKRQGTSLLPSNWEVQQQILAIAKKIDGEEHQRRLHLMRSLAAQLMETLASFSPRLIGSVWTGHIRKGSDIDLHLYSEDPQPVEAALQRAGYTSTTEIVLTHKYGEPREFTHVRLADLGGFEVEMTLYPPQEIHIQPRCSITGKTMKRGTLAELRQLLAASPQPESSHNELLTVPLDWNQAIRLIPELLDGQGVAQNHYHHLDVFDHTVEVVAGLQQFLTDGFQRFGPWAPALVDLFAEPQQLHLLMLAGLCHDIAKPATRTLGRDGCIHFYDHDRLGAQMVRPISGRLGLSYHQTDQLSALVDCHLDAVILSQGGKSSQIHRLFARTKDCLPHLAVLSLADVEAARGPAQSTIRLEEQLDFAQFLMEQYYTNGFFASPVLPIDQEDLLDEFGALEPKVVQRLLDELLEEYLDGEFDGRQDGLALAAELLNSHWKS